MKREFGGKVYSDIVDNSWVSIGPPPPPPSPNRAAMGSSSFYGCSSSLHYPYAMCSLPTAPSIL
eukprot:8926963-Pyramimonas_sp.AAC.1